MRWPKFRRADDPVDTDSVAETPAEPVQTATAEVDTKVTPTARHRIHWSRVVAYGMLPGLALLLALAAGFLKWQDGSVRDPEEVRLGSVQAAKDGTVALLSYQPQTVQTQLEAAKDGLTGTFLDEYTKLTHDVVIPGAQEKQISAEATVQAAASMSETANEAVVLLFVNQTTIVGQGVPTSSASTVRVTLEKVDGRWLISKFDPV